MKTEASFESNRFAYDSKPETLNDFWNDCIELKDKKQSKNKNIYNDLNPKQKSKNINIDYYPHTQYHPNIGRNKNGKFNKKTKTKTYNSVKNFNQQKNENLSINNKLNNSTEKYLATLYKRHPSYMEDMSEKENQKIKSKNALIRCLGLYAYGLELEKTKKMNKENMDKQRIKNDLSKCTFKPKVNKKISFLDQKIECTKEANPLYKKFLNKSVNNMNKNNKDDSQEKYTFKPKFESDPSYMQKMFKNSRNRSISNKRENAQFILRYTKARDEYLIRKIKKMYRKDDSYDKILLNVTKRFCNKQYKNYLNVNNTIFLYGETIVSNEPLHSSIADFKGVSITSEVPEQKQTKNDNYIVGLRKNLHSLDLSENAKE
jgi:hypothetical protein